MENCIHLNRATSPSFVAGDDPAATSKDRNRLQGLGPRAGDGDAVKGHWICHFQAQIALGVKMALRMDEVRDMVEGVANLHYGEPASKNAKINEFRFDTGECEGPRGQQAGGDFPGPRGTQDRMNRRVFLYERFSSSSKNPLRLDLHHRAIDVIPPNFFPPPPAARPRNPTCRV
jgi:hypothetical protein